MISTIKSDLAAFERMEATARRRCQERAEGELLWEVAKLVREEIANLSEGGEADLERRQAMFVAAFILLKQRMPVWPEHAAFDGPPEEKK